MKEWSKGKQGQDKIKKKKIIKSDVKDGSRINIT